MADWFLAVGYIFSLQLFTTRALNSEADDRFRKLLWTIERACLAGVAAGFVAVQFWLVQIAMTAAVAVFLLRALIRFFGLGIVRIGNMAGYGLSVLGQVTCALLVAFGKALPEAIADAASKSDSNEIPEIYGTHPFIYGKDRWDW